MSEDDGAAELLFFDTFSHETTDINLDLVQFPKPVYITQVRIIPLGARVKADFPGGVRLGATNPSKFGIEFFVNDLGLAGASTFEILGSLEYNQNDCIHLECNQERIPTDGLVLRGWYSTITLAVYGILTNSVSEPIASPPPPPCEPVGLEEVCNISSSDGRNSNSQDDLLKEEWKEPPPEEIVQAHKSKSSEFEARDDFDYSMTREHYVHSSDEEERTHRSKHSSDHSSSRNRTVSENNERDYIRSRSEREREKSNRDWSRSPDYARRSRRKRSERSRSEAEEVAHKWPRTPPPTTIIDSPARPRSPDNIEFMDGEDLHYKVKARPYGRSSDSIENVEQETQPVDDDETPGTPGEQFEPILSDDEIIGDDDFGDNVESSAQAEEFEAEVDISDAPPAIEQFDAFTMPTRRYDYELRQCYDKDVDNLKLLFKKFDMQTKSTSSSPAAFMDACTGSDERESFVFLSEQLINQLAYLSQNFKRRNYVLKQLFAIHHHKHNYLQQSYCYLRIGLDFDAACSQAQPAFKIRHMKVGARLAELLASSEEFMHYVLFERQYQLLPAILDLYQQHNMALSIKLLLLKAIYALLDTKSGLQHFFNAKVNGYQLVLELLQRSHLTRNKCALLAIVNKLNLLEALDCIQENAAKLFVFGKCEEGVTEVGELHQLIETSMELVMEAMAGNALSYQQPRRFLPVSKKFEIMIDAAGQRSFANSLQAFFIHKSLGESLLLLLTNAASLPASLLAHTINLLQALLHSHVGVDYLVDDCFETTQMLISILLGIEEVPPEEPALGAEPEGGADKKEPDQTVKGEESAESKPDGTLKAAPSDEAEPEKVAAGVAVAAPDAKAKDKDKELSPATEAVESPAPATDEAEVHEPSVEANRNVLLNHLQQIGVELAFKVQTRYQLDAIFYKATGKEYDSIGLASHLHALYSQTTNSPGREHTVELLGLNNQLQLFMDIIKKEQHLQAQRQLSSPGAKYKSPVLSYAVDMVDCCVRYCENLQYLNEHGSNILELAKNHDTFEPSVSAVLQEMYVYLKPLEVINLSAYDDIMPLIEVITRSLEYISTFPGDLIMGLRILRHLVLGPVRKGFESTKAEELKRRFVALQFYAADGVQIIVQILEKLCSYFEQPGLHAPALVTTQGAHCCQIILPALQILRDLLTYAIQCRDVDFKDLTAVDHLLRTYFLMYYFPANSQASADVQLAKREIIDTLLAYTQPNEQDEESLHKSLWTQMIREILKNISGPSTFLPGLQVLSELLPLPLPIPVPRDLELIEAHQQRLLTERKLWSAHLHPQSAQLSKLIETIAPTAYPQLHELLVRVCWQLADLAPNMTLLISKTMAELICTEWAQNSNAPSALLARLLHFLARLVSYACMKSSTLSILGGKLWELFDAILTSSETSEVLAKCQVATHRILLCLLDARISLISPQTTSAPELNLASALPPKELIPRLAEDLLGNLLSADCGQPVAALCCRNLQLLTEHDITFHHLALQLRQKAADFQRWLRKLSDLEGPQPQLVRHAARLLLSLMSAGEPDAPHPDFMPRRQLRMSPSELAALLAYRKDNADSPHALQVLRSKMAVKEPAPAQEAGESEGAAALSALTLLLSQLDEAESLGAMEAEDDTGGEPSLPQSEGIVTQYSARPIFLHYGSTIDSELLSINYWLNVVGIDESCARLDGQQTERVACDLTELANTCLPPDTNLTTDCKRIFHLSASPQSNRERTPTAPCFRTRRVEVEPSTGRPEKKIYVTPVRGRGFPRVPQSRGDLFRSRPPNTSRPPSLHVDDFQALETCGAQPTGPTGYNKIPPIIRGSRVGRSRGSRISSAALYRKSKVMRTSSPSWNDGGSPHYRTATAEPHFGSDPHYASSPHYSGRPRGRGRPRPYLR